MRPSNPQTRLILGAALLIFGALALLDNLALFHFGLSIKFWPLVFIAIGVLKISKSQNTSGYIIGGGFIFFGAMLTLHHTGFISFRMRDWWPLFIIFAGLLVIFKDRQGSPFAPASTQQSEKNCNLVAFMSGNQTQNMSHDFQGGELTAVMGGIELDLRHADIQQAQVKINVFAIWGGISLKVPQGWTVVSQVVPLLGGAEDGTLAPAQRDKVLLITGYAIMGGIEIKN